MKHEDLPERWKDKLKTYLRETLKQERDTLSACDFHYNVKIDFLDQSSAFFYYAFFIKDEDSGEFAVFTEHCGYHVFPLAETRVELLELVWNDTENEEE